MPVAHGICSQVSESRTGLALLGGRFVSSADGGLWSARGIRTRSSSLRNFSSAVEEVGQALGIFAAVRGGEA